MDRYSHSRRKRIRGVSPVLQVRAIELRKATTAAEKELWKAVRHKKLGVRFRRQHSVGRFILDFYCPACKLVVEVDGEIHQSRSQQDQARTEHLELYGYTILRFANEEVLNNLPRVLETIKAAMIALGSSRPK